MTIEKFLDLRRAQNWQCLHCVKPRRIFATPQGLGSHLYRVHGIKGGTKKSGKDFAGTQRRAQSDYWMVKMAREATAAVLAKKQGVA